MNPQIQLILAQARSQVRQDLEYSPDALLPQELVDEKFAQLIVRECISALDNEVYLATREDGEQAFHDVILLEHFGVAE
jgi:hypothetical protein